MKIFSGQPARSSEYDRTPAVKAIFYQASGVAPHIATSRASYTVPAGRKARVTSYKLQTDRATAATTAGKVGVYALYTPSGQGALTVRLSYSLSNTVGFTDEINSPGFDILLPGDVLAIYTVDASTGGTMNYDLAVNILEFDA